MFGLFTPNNDRSVGRIFRKNVMYSELQRVRDELNMLLNFYHSFTMRAFMAHPENIRGGLLVDPDVQRWTYDLISLRSQAPGQQPSFNYVQNVLDGFVQPAANENPAWAYMVYQRTGEKWGLSVSEDEVEARIIKASTFGDQVDLSVFHDVLDQLNVSERQVIEALRRFFVVEKMARLTFRSSIGSKQAIYEQFKSQEQERKFLFLKFAADDYKDQVETKEEDIIAYYKDNKKNKYSVPRKIKVRCAMLPFENLKGDVAVSDNQIEEYYERYKKHLYVKERQPGENEGDPEVVVYLPLGEVEDQVKDNLKYEALPDIVKEKADDMKEELEKWLEEKKEVVQKRKDEEKEEAEKKEKESTESEQPSEDVAEDDDDEVEKPVPDDPTAIKFEDNELALDFNLLKKLYGKRVEFVDSVYFNPMDFNLKENEELEDLYSVEFAAAVKTINMDTLSSVVMGPDGAMVFQIIAESSKGIKSYEAVQETVKDDYIFDTAKKLADQDCVVKFTLIEGDVNIAKLAEDHSLSLYETGFVKNPARYRSEIEVEGIPDEDFSVISQVFRQEPNVAKRETTAKASYIFTVMELKDPEVSALEDFRIQSGMQQTRRNTIRNNTFRLQQLVLDYSGADYKFATQNVSQKNGS